MDIFEGLNENQREAVMKLDGALMVIAGAGSGKTKVLTHRIAYLLENGIDAFNILSLTFTNKAAREMKERIAGLIGSSEAGNLWMGTFHSVFSKILRIEGSRLGYHSNFTIYDTEDSKRIIKKIISDLNLDSKVYVAGNILSRISSAKTNLISATDYVNNAELTTQDALKKVPETGTIYSIYQKSLYQSSAMDFDDILFFMNVLLRDFPDVLLKYQQKFRYILVDEYQDTNFAQYLILKKLAARHHNICIVGDDAQSIYAFRGANIQNILNFQSDYPECVVIKLEQNYRSTQNIVNAANSLIEHNKGRIRKTVWTNNEKGGKIKVVKSASDNDEGMTVAGLIFEMKMNRQLRNKDFAILYRTNSQSRAMEEGLRRLNIPYKVYGGLSFYKRKEIKDILAYFRLVINNYDTDALLRVINYPSRGIGDTSINKIVVKANQLGLPVWDIVSDRSHYNEIVGASAGRIEKFSDMIKRFSAQLAFLSAGELSKNIIFGSGIKSTLEEDATPEGISRVENIEELLNAINEFSENENNITMAGNRVEPNENNIRTLDMFMQDIALLTDQDNDDDDDDKVTLMTIHAAKGLEFPVVFIVGMEEQLFPSYMSIESRDDLEEERRLFYVALTRAEQYLTLSYADSRYRWGQLTFCEPSRFLSEIDDQLLDLSFKVSAKKQDFAVINEPRFTSKAPLDITKYKKIEKNSDEVPIAASQLNIMEGMTVEHDKFGRGAVIKIDGNGSDKKAIIKFSLVGEKQLLLKFAKLKIV